MYLALNSRLNQWNATTSSNLKIPRGSTTGQELNEQCRACIRLLEHVIRANRDLLAASVDVDDLTEEAALMVWRKM